MSPDVGGLSLRPSVKPQLYAGNFDCSFVFRQALFGAGRLVHGSVRQGLDRMCPSSLALARVSGRA